jgi:hypothetical protein
MNNTDPPIPGWTQELAEGKPLLFHIRHQPCNMSCYNGICTISSHWLCCKLVENFAVIKKYSKLNLTLFPFLQKSHYFVSYSDIYIGHLVVYKISIFGFLLYSAPKHYYILSSWFLIEQHYGYFASTYIWTLT